MIADKEKLIEMIESTPFDIEREIGNFLESKEAVQNIWGYSIENHVKRIINNFDGAEILDYEEFSNVTKNGYLCKYVHRTDSLGIENIFKVALDVDGIPKGYEYDVLFKMDGTFHWGEIKYLKASARHRHERNPLKKEYYEPRITVLENFFGRPVEAWAILNYEYVDNLKTHLEDQYLQFTSLGHKVMSLGVDEETRKTFFKEVHSRCPRAKFNRQYVAEINA